MITYAKNSAVTLLDCEDYYIQTEWNGWENTLNFTLPVNLEQAVDLCERLRLAVTDEIEGRTGQIYVITSYNKSGKNLSITAELDLDELRAGMALDWSMTDTLANVISAVLPDGWSVVDNTGRTDTQTIEDFCGNPLELIEEAIDIWANVGAQFDNVQHTVTLFSATANTAKGSYFTTDLNLKETPSIRGKAASGTYYNRLYLRGKDGLELPSPGYVEDLTYSSRIVSVYKEESDIETQAELLAKANDMVSAASVPDRSYTCKLVDLYKLQPEKYTFLAYEMYDIIVLLDPDTYNRAYQRINRISTYPHYPEKNTVVLSTVPGTITNTIKQAASRAALARKQAQSAQNQAEAAIESASNANQAANNALAQAQQAIKDAASAADTANSANELAAAIDAAYQAADAAAKAYADQIAAKVDSVSEAYQAADAEAKAYADEISAKVDSVSEAYQAADTAAQNTYNAKLSELEEKTKDASNITAGTLDAAKVNVINIDAGNINTGSLNADLITSGALKADYIKGGTLDASQITVKNLDAGAITSGSINASLITSGALSASYIKGGELDASQITVKNLDAGSITTGSFNASLITTGVLDAGLIQTGTLSSINIYGTTITGSTVRGGTYTGKHPASDMLDIGYYSGDNVVAGTDNFIELNPDKGLCACDAVKCYDVDNKGNDSVSKGVGYCGVGMTGSFCIDTPNSMGELTMYFSNGILVAYDWDD